MFPQIDPSVVWALDPAIRPIVERWYETVPRDARVFVRVAVSREDAKQCFIDYNEQGFKDRLRAVDVAPRDMTRVTVVLVATAMGPEAFTDWDSAETYIERLSNEVQDVEVHRILVADHRGFLPNERRIKAVRPRAVPWLLSTRNSHQRRLTDSDLAADIALLVGGLVFGERRREHQIKTVFDTQRADGCVKLLGQPERSPARVIEDVVEVLTHSVLAATVREGRAGLPPAASARVEVSTREEFLAGSRSASGVVNQLIGSGGLAGWMCEQAIEHGPRYLSRFVAGLRAAIEADRHSDATKPEGPQPVGGAISRFFGWLARSLRLKPASPPQLAPTSAPTRPSDDSLTFVSSTIDRANRLLSSLRELADVERSSVGIPAPVMAEWRTMVSQDVRLALESIAEGRASAAADVLVDKWRKRVRSDVLSRINEVSTSWSFGDQQLLRDIRGIGDPKSLRYSAHRMGGDVELYAIALSDGLVLPGARSLSHRFWRGAGVMMLAVSEAVSIDELGW